MAADSRTEAWARVQSFCWAVRKARGWTQREVVQHADAHRRPYVSLSTYEHFESGTSPHEVKPVTLRRIELALQVEPGTLTLVLNSPDHGLDPASLPLYKPPALVPLPRTSDGLSPEQRQSIASHIADRAATGRAS